MKYLWATVHNELVTEILISENKRNPQVLTTFFYLFPSWKLSETGIWHFHGKVVEVTVIVLEAKDGNTDKPRKGQTAISKSECTIKLFNTLRPRQNGRHLNISQKTFSSAFSWMKMYKFRLRFRWSLFLWVKLIIFQHWFSNYFSVFNPPSCSDAIW